MPETNHMIWYANGVLLAFLALTPRRRWPAYLMAGLSAQIAGSIFFNAQWR
jgi:integral membrane sensor domain MASE1